MSRHGVQDAWGGAVNHLAAIAVCTWLAGAIALPFGVGRRWFDHAGVDFGTVLVLVLAAMAWPVFMTLAFLNSIRSGDDA